MNGWPTEWVNETYLNTRLVVPPSAASGSKEPQDEAWEELKQGQV